MAKLAIYLLSCLSLISAAPIENDYITWQNEPNGRGTWSILSSCIVTLVLCVYTAVHMNVPPASRSDWQRRKHTMVWVCAGIFAPELVVWAAWQQWSEARQLTKKIKAFEAERDDGPEKERLKSILESWTIKHSFFVVMGGYQIHPSNLPELQEIRFEMTWGDYWLCLVDDNIQYPALVLTPSGLMDILKQGKGHTLPKLTAQDIDDRSKADNLAKLLSCVQGLWLVAQIISRLAVDLAITELEVNTLAHVICAFLVYAFWMKKPLKVEQPVWLEHEYFTDKTSVTMSLFWPISLCLPLRALDSQSRRELLDSGLSVTTHKTHPLGSREFCPICRENRLSNPDEGLVLCLAPKLTESVEGVIAYLNSKPSTRIVFLDFVSSDNVRAFKYPVKQIGNQFMLKHFLRFWSSPVRDASIDQFFAHDYNIKFDMLSRSSPMIPSHYWDNMRSICVMIAVSSLYGGIHASLWRHHFPTMAELWLWRLSSLVVAGNGLFLACLISTIEFLDWRKAQTNCTNNDIGTSWANSIIWTPVDLFIKLIRKVSKSSRKLAENFDWLFKCVIGVGLLVFYAVQAVFAFCRIFLFIEAFISLRSQPPSVYETPNWTQWLPHL